MWLSICFRRIFIRRLILAITLSLLKRFMILLRLFSAKFQLAIKTCISLDHKFFKCIISVWFMYGFKTRFVWSIYQEFQVRPPDWLQDVFSVYCECWESKWTHYMLSWTFLRRWWYVQCYIVSKVANYKVIINIWTQLTPICLSRAPFKTKKGYYDKYQLIILFIFTLRSRITLHVDIFNVL